MALDYQDINVEVTETTISASISEVLIEASIADTSEITVEIAEVVVAVDVTDTEEITVDVIDTEEITVEVSGWSCPSGGSGGAGYIFITDATSSGIVSDLVYEADTVPASKVLTAATSDVDLVTISFQAEGGEDYSPIVSIGDTTCSNLQQVVGDLRIFTGSIQATMTQATEVFTISSDTGFSASITLNQGAAAPEILTCVIGDYPGAQTAAKAGDNIHVTGTVEASATHVRIVASGGFVDSGWVSCSGGTFDVVGTINSASGLQGAVVYAKNSVGSEGGNFSSSNQITLDQAVPQFSFSNITYPSGQTAFKGVEAGSIDVSVTDYTSLTYSSPHGDFTVANTATYEQDKSITCTSPGDYNDSSTNFRIVALKSSNATSNTYNRTIEVADTAPLITMSQPDTRLRSSSSGSTYSISAVSNQSLVGVLTIAIPVSGSWVGAAFSGGPKSFTRGLTIDDDDAKGSGAWALGASIVSRSGLAATITGTQVVGGFVARDIALPAFGTTVSLGTSVVTAAKLSLTWTVKASMIYQAIGTPAPVVAGWTISSTGTNPTTITILDSQAAASSSQESTLNIQEAV